MDKEKSYVPCGICKLTFDESTVLQNSKNDAYCTDCFKRTLCLGPEKSYCAAGDTRTTTQEPSASRITKILKAKKMIPRPEVYVRNSNLFCLQTSPSTTSMVSISKRPLQCPKPDCSKFISVCTLERHFHTEHREVPVVSTYLDARCASEIFPRDIRYGIVQCIVLLKIVDDDVQWLRQESKINLSSETANPVMMVMATRVSNYGSSSEVYFEEHDVEEKTTFVTAQKNTCVEEVFRPGDRIIVWLASNIGTNLNYTVAVSTLDNEIRQKYFGPMLTLNEHPERICKEGDCLILTQLHCIAMSKNGTKPLALDVVIHSPD